MNVRHIEPREYQVNVSNVCADFNEARARITVTLSPKYIVGLLNGDLSWVTGIETEDLLLVSPVAGVVARWPLSNGKAFYETLPTRPHFPRPAQEPTDPTGEQEGKER
jgi:hypothetical protein